MKEKTEEKEKKLKSIIVMEKFMNALKKVKNEGTKENPEYDLSKILPYTQLTWKKATKNPSIALLTVKEKVFVGKVAIRLRKRLSDVCDILELRTGSGIFSAKVICEMHPYKPDKDGEWGVNPLSIYHLK